MILLKCLLGIAAAMATTPPPPAAAAPASDSCCYCLAAACRYRLPLSRPSGLLAPARALSEPPQCRYWIALAPACVGFGVVVGDADAAAAAAAVSNAAAVAEIVDNRLYC